VWPTIRQECAGRERVANKASIGLLSGQVKSGQWWSGKIRPTDFPGIWGSSGRFWLSLNRIFCRSPERATTRAK
jgi:hypothetical protein